MRARGRSAGAAGLAALALLMSCSADTRGSASARQRSPSASAAPTEETRVLDLEAEPMRVPALTRIPYGARRDRLGYLPPCTGRRCADPCPCSAHLQPGSFDLDATGAAWILDAAKERLAVFDATGELVRAQPLPGVGYRAWDVQAHPDFTIVMSQDVDYYGRVTFVAPDSVRAGAIRYEGSPIATGGPVTVDGDAGYVAAFEDTPTGDEELFLSVPLEPARSLRATQALGRPMLDGWLLLREYRGDRVIRLAYEAPVGSWETHLRLLTRTAGDHAPRDRGIISWEIEIAPDGTIHLLVHGARARSSGYWYVRVAADGTPGDVVRLEGPRIADDQQSRRLTLDASGRPFVMWAQRRGVVISSLESVQS